MVVTTGLWSPKTLLGVPVATCWGTERVYLFSSFRRVLRPLESAFCLGDRRIEVRRVGGMLCFGEDGEGSINDYRRFQKEMEAEASECGL